LPTAAVSKGPKWRAIGLYGGLALIALVFWHAAFTDLRSIGEDDWQFFAQMWEAARVAIQRFGEWPLWNPYQCGGITLWGNPQSPAFSPLFLPALALGTALALKARLLLLCWLGLAGMHRLATRVYGLRTLPALLAAVAWVCSGFFSWHTHVGHVPFQTFWLFPWVLYFARRAEADLRYCAAAAAAIFFMVIDGATYPLPYLGLFLACDTLFRLPAVAARTRLRRLVALAWTGALALTMSALRIVPTLITLRRMPRNLSDTDSISLSDALLILTARKHEWRFDPHQYTWHEYGCFIGWTVLALGSLGFMLALRKRPSLAASAVFFLLCMLGNVAPFFPWPLLKKLPVLESLRIPSRFVVLFTFYVSLLAALALDWIQAQLERFVPAQGAVPRALRAGLVPLILLAVGMDIFSVNLATNELWTGGDLPRAPPEGRYYLIASMGHVNNFRPIQGRLPQEERGSAQCYEALTWPVPDGLWTGDVPQVRISGAGQVLDWGHTANTMWADLDLPEQARVVFNQTFAPGWRSSRAHIVDDAGRSAVDAPPGRYRLRLEYRPRELGASLLATLFGIGLALLTTMVKSPSRLSRLAARWKGPRRAPARARPTAS
jgi:hypothetical protein